MAVSRRVVLGLLAACYALLAVAWLMGNPPGASPDEGDHYLRALAVGAGDLRGRPNPDLAGQPTTLPKSVGVGPLEALWLAKGARIEPVPVGLVPVGWGCQAFRPSDNASCLLGPPPSAATEAKSTVGTVEPGLYVVPGLAARLGSRPESALRLGRLANAAVVLSLLAAAAALVWRPSRSPLVLGGLLLAVTPMVIFVGSSLSPSGPEVAAGICFFAAVLALGRGEGDRAVWAAAGLSGVVLAASRSLGPIWVLLMVGVVVACRGWKPCWVTLRQGRAPAVAAAVAIGAAAMSTAVWEKAYQPGVDFDGSYFWKQVPPSLSGLPDVGRDLVGHFGWLDTRMPLPAYLAWAAMVVVLVGLALVVGTGRQRAVLCAVPVALVVITTLISAGLLRQNGFEVQGRHVLAFAAILPLLAAEILVGNGGRDRPAGAPRVLLGFAAPAIAVQAVAWYVNARRYAVGTNGPIWFAGHARWSPPGSWGLWGAVALAGLAAGVAAAWLASREPTGDAVYASRP